MKLRDEELAATIDRALLRFHEEKRPVPGILDPKRRRVFIEQLVESLHRVAYPKVSLQRDVSPSRGNPQCSEFDPIKAAILQLRAGSVDEACWLIFLFVHFGKHPRGGYRYAREVYGRLGQGGYWNWASVSSDIGGFRQWLADNIDELRRSGEPGGFGNHRKYESLHAYSVNGTGAVVDSYVNWVGPPRTHRELFKDANNRAAGDPRRAFDILYASLGKVRRFGRTARFDYLTMLGKLEITPIEPGSGYIASSTGPLSGARLLFEASDKRQLTPKELESAVQELGSYIGIGMQALEDTLCNWQKSPGAFKAFRG